MVGIGAGGAPPAAGTAQEAPPSRGHGPWEEEVSMSAAHSCHSLLALAISAPLGV